MKVAFVTYDGLTMLDFSEVYDPVTRLKTIGFVGDLEYDVCARTDTRRVIRNAPACSPAGLPIRWPCSPGA